MVVEVMHSMFSEAHSRTRLAGFYNWLMRGVTSRKTQRRLIFSDVYRRNLWGKDDKDGRYYSGFGSRGAAARFYVERMAELLRTHATEFGRPLTVVDLGCGDFQIGRALVAALPELTYIGCDIVPEVIAHNKNTFATSSISFFEMDIVTDRFPAGDVYLIRQVFQHLSNADITSVLHRVNCKYLYVTEGQPAEGVGPANPDHISGVGVRFDLQAGRGRGVELNKPPWNLTTQEMFRCPSSPQEVLVTELVIPSDIVGRD